MPRAAAVRAAPVLLLLLAAFALPASAQLPGGTPVSPTTTDVGADTPPTAPIPPGGTANLAVTVRYTYTALGAAASDGPTEVAITIAASPAALTADPPNATIEISVAPGGPEMATAEGTASFTLRCAGSGIVTLTLTAEAAQNGILDPSQGTNTTRVTCAPPPVATPPPGSGTNTTGPMTGNNTTGNTTAPPPSNEPAPSKGLPGFEAALAVAGLGAVALRRRRP
ncbi:MAG TPA: PGF-CTERM sorting domain-containing protein [Candidatus Thermoplasmatota archaeon]|jgi:PGF-CTERM protein|nr:PGF-CTERM sorting domain-containing protein [Candidatus Thermoplasmatota archaeon]